MSKTRIAFHDNRLGETVEQLYLVVICVGLIAGLVVGRWWAIVLALAAGTWIALDTSVDEVPAWFLGTAYAVLAGAGIAAGVGLRRRGARR